VASTQVGQDQTLVTTTQNVASKQVGQDQTLVTTTQNVASTQVGQEKLWSQPLKMWQAPSHNKKNTNPNIFTGHWTPKNFLVQNVPL
jgi:hypothetical protein